MAQQSKIRKQLKADIREAKLLLDRIKVNLQEYGIEQATNLNQPADQYNNIHTGRTLIEHAISYTRRIDKLI